MMKSKWNSAMNCQVTLAVVLLFVDDKGPAIGRVYHQCCLRRILSIVSLMLGFPITMIAFVLQLPAVPSVHGYTEFQIPLASTS